MEQIAQLLDGNKVNNDTRVCMRGVAPIQLAAIVRPEQQLVQRCFNINDSLDDNEDGGYTSYVVGDGHNHGENSFKSKVDIPNFNGRMSIEKT